MKSTVVLSKGIHSFRSQSSFGTGREKYRQATKKNISVEFHDGSRRSSVSIVSRLWARRPAFDSRQGLVFSSCHHVQTGSGAHQFSYPMGIGAELARA
jgi:hypothetical protein